MKSDDETDHSELDDYEIQKQAKRRKLEKESNNN